MLSATDSRSGAVDPGGRMGERLINVPKHQQVCALIGGELLGDGMDRSRSSQWKDLPGAGHSEVGDIAPCAPTAREVRLAADEHGGLGRAGSAMSAAPGEGRRVHRRSRACSAAHFRQPRSWRHECRSGSASTAASVIA
jgi:hypothetical protein